MAGLCSLGLQDNVPCSSAEQHPPSFPPSLPRSPCRASDTRGGRCLCAAPWQPRCGQIMAQASLLLLLLFYLLWDTISDKASVGRFLWQSSHDIWLQMAWAYPTPPLADNFKGTVSPFSCLSCPNSSASRALILARLFIKCIIVTVFTGLDLRRNLGFWPDKTKLGRANLLKIEVLWTSQIIFLCSWGSKTRLRSWTFPLLLLSFETSFYFQEWLVLLKEYFLSWMGVLCYCMSRHEMWWITRWKKTLERKAHHHD